MLILYHSPTSPNSRRVWILLWCERLMERPSWQTTQPTAEAMEAVRSRLKAQMTQQQTQRFAGDSSGDCVEQAQ